MRKNVWATDWASKCIIGVLMVSKTTLGDNFPTGEFLIKKCNLSFRHERNNHGDIMLYVREEILSKLMSSENYL